MLRCSLKPAFAAPQRTAAAASSSAELPFEIVNTFGAQEGTTTSAGSRRLLARRGKKMLGLVVKVCVMNTSGNIKVYIKQLGVDLRKSVLVPC